LKRSALSVRVDLAPGGRVGPGKVRLLELIAQTGSISAAGREMNMSYRRAWMLVDSLNQALGTEVVETRTGGSAGGGAHLTEAGREIVQRYRALEAKAGRAAAPDIEALEALARRGRAES